MEQTQSELDNMLNWLGTQKSDRASGFRSAIKKFTESMLPEEPRTLVFLEEHLDDLQIRVLDTGLPPDTAETYAQRVKRAIGNYRQQLFAPHDGDVGDMETVQSNTVTSSMPTQRGRYTRSSHGKLKAAPSKKDEIRELNRSLSRFPGLKQELAPTLLDMLLKDEPTEGSN